MTESTAPVPQGWRVLGFGKHTEVAAAVQGWLRGAGLRARDFALTDDDARRLATHQENWPRSSTTASPSAASSTVRIQRTLPTPRHRGLNRVLNLIHLHAPTAKITRIRNPADALSTTAGRLVQSTPWRPSLYRCHRHAAASDFTTARPSRPRRTAGRWGHRPATVRAGWRLPRLRLGRRRPRPGG